MKTHALTLGQRVTLAPDREAWTRFCYDAMNGKTGTITEFGNRYGDRTVLVTLDTPIRDAERAGDTEHTEWWFDPSELTPL